MSYSQMQSIPGSSQADEYVQRQLQSLLQQLSWSYVALWSFIHQTRNLEWRGGHFRVTSTAMTSHGDTELWNEHLFNSTYKSCTFVPGQGSVGTAYAETRTIWMNGPSVHNSAGSKEQAQFLQHARIETAVCIPWADSVLELGTCETMAENLDLTVYMRIFLSEHILPALGQAPPTVSQSSLAARATVQSGPFPSLSPTRHLSDKFLNQEFELNELNEQIRRSSSLSSLNTDIFWQQPEEGEGKELGSGLDMGIPLTDPTWRSATTTRAADVFQMQKPPLPAPNQVLMSARGQYRSHSGTTSSSVSISEDGSVRLSVDSPEHLMTSSQRRNSHSNTSSSPRRGTPSHSPEIQIGDTNTATGISTLTQNLRVEDDIQQAISHMLGEGEVALDSQEQWRNMYPALELGNIMGEMNVLDTSTMPNMNPLHTQVDVRDELRPPFKSWRPTRIQAPVLRKSDCTNQALLRRCIEMMKRISNMRQGIRTETGAAAQNTSLQGSRLTSSSSPETLTDIGIEHDPFDQTAPLRGQRRPRGGPRVATTGAMHAGHDEAAMNHMMAERRRRIKQKENFSALRKLVPIISKKADKASILGDATVYIKDLQERINELEASRAQTESRYENLKESHLELEQRNKELEQRNKELDAMAENSGGASHMQRSPSLHPSRQSF